MNELKTVYSIKDALNIYEAKMVPLVNQYWAQKEAQKEAKKGQR